MTDRVFSIAKSLPSAPDPDVLNMAKWLLKMAESGEVRGLAVAIDCADESTAYATAYANGCRVISLLGAVVKLQSRVESESDAYNATDSAR